MRILLTGAEGFTGRHLCDAARRQGHEVVALSADLTDAGAVRADVQTCRFDAVLHLAGLAFVGHADPLAFYRVNVMGTLNLLNAVAEQARRAPGAVRQVVVASSANVYGNCDTSPISEDQATAPVNHYAASKLAMEHLVLAAAGDLPVRVARPFNYTGPGQSEDFVIPKMVAHFKARRPTLKLGNLHVQREYNDVSLVCEAYLRLLALPKPPAPRARIVNLCSGVMYDLQTVVDLLSRLSGHELTVERDPALVRPQEVHQLCGDPSGLHRLIGPMPQVPLADTLQAMLQA
jgi:nucleoside-diphosphate-sugar epimerase